MLDKKHHKKKKTYITYHMFDGFCNIVMKQ